MNRRGVALAANMPETFFPIAPDVPVTIVAFGANDMMGVPWETIIRMYARQLGTRTYATLEEYAASLFAFIERSDALCPTQLQAERVRQCVASLWTDYRDRIEAITDQRATTSAAERRVELATILREDRHDCEGRADVAALGEGFGARVVATYVEQIDELEDETFGDMQLTQQLHAELRSVLALMYEKEWCHPHDESGIAIAGLGDDEPFPSVLVYSVGTVVAGRLRYMLRQSVKIGVDRDASVVPFAHRETIDTIVDGVHPDLIGAIRGELQALVESQHAAPFMAAMAGLPRREMVRMAEALVTTSTFAESACAAMLSKAAGFAWVTHDNPVRYPSQELYHGTARSE
ncbi:MAG: hypothetical protein ABI431_08225 [Candidatus Tumulicola sp.]